MGQARAARVSAFVAPQRFPPTARNEIGPLPRDLQIPVQIDIAISSKAEHAAWATRFIAYLRSAEVGRILKEKGCTPRH